MEDFAKENGIDRIEEIVLDIGELSLVVPKYVEEIYPIATKGTILDGVKLIRV